MYSINVDKTERTTIGHPDLGIDQSWCKTCKLGSLLGVDDDRDRRIQLAAVAFNSLEKL